MVAEFFFIFSFFFYDLTSTYYRKRSWERSLTLSYAGFLVVVIVLVKGWSKHAHAQACANCLVILKLFLHTDFHAKNETGKFISIIRMVRFTRLLICHTIKLKPSPSEFTAPCELLFSSVFIVIKTKTKTTNNVSSRLCKSCILKWLDNWVFYLSSCNKPTVSQKRIKRQGFFLDVWYS